MTDREPEQASSFDGSESRKLDQLDARISKYKLEHEEPPAKKDGAGQGLGFGMRLLSDLVAGLVLGLLLGYWLDQWLGTTPWMLLVFLIVGLAAGILNVIRAAESESKRQKEAQETEEKKAALAARIKTSGSDDAERQGDAVK